MAGIEGIWARQGGSRHETREYWGGDVERQMEAFREETWEILE